MKLHLIQDYSTLQGHANDWDRVAGDFPFFRFAWMGSWLKHLGQGVCPAVLVATDESDKWIGIAPWCLTQHNHLARKLRWISSGSACADYARLLALPGFESAFAEAAVDWLCENAGADGPLGSLAAIELEGMASCCDQATLFTELMSASGFRQYCEEIEGCWRVELPAAWTELEPKFSKSMRRKTKKATKRLNDEQTVILSSHDVDFEELWPTFVHLHQKRRGMLGQSGCFAAEGFENFLADAMRSLIASGHAELVEIRHAGEPLASMVLLNDGQTVFMYQSGMCDQRTALEPGYQMAACAIQRSIEAGFSGFDFLRGDEPYKARWNTTRIPLSRVKFIPRTFSARLKHTLWLTGKSLKGRVLAEA